MARVLTCLALLSILLGSAWSQSKVVQSEDGSAGTIKFSTPDLDDDDAHSPWMPDILKCDACRAVAFCVSRSSLIEFGSVRVALDYEQWKSAASGGR